MLDRSSRRRARQRCAALVSTLAGLAAASGILLACGCGGGSASGGTRAQTTPLYLTDAPLTGATAVNVTLSKIEARTAGGESGETYVDTGVTYSGNLLDLKNTNALLGNAPLPAGQYTGLRLTVSAATITVNGVTYPLEPVTGRGSANDKPAHGKAGEAVARKHGADVSVGADGRSATLKINAPFTVAADGTGTPLLLDFNVAHSVVATGNGHYLLKPVIPVVHKDEAGEVSGEVTLSPAPADSDDAPEIQVSAAPAGSGEDEAENATAAQGARTGGRFRIAALPRGTYDVTVTAQGYAPVTLPGVLITPGQKPDLGKITLRKP